MPPTPFPAKARKGAYLKQREHFPLFASAERGKRRGGVREFEGAIPSESIYTLFIQPL